MLEHPALKKEIVLCKGKLRDEQKNCGKIDGTFSHEFRLNGVCNTFSIYIWKVLKVHELQ